MKSKEEYNKYMRKYVKERARKRMEEAKARLGGKCANCPATENLDFDHIDRTTKSFTISCGAAGFSEERWQAEIAKCQLLCHECHLKKTLNEKGFKDARNTHGTLASARYCKCRECKDVKNAYMREWKKRNNLGS